MNWKSVEGEFKYCPNCIHGDSGICHPGIEAKDKAGDRSYEPRTASASRSYILRVNELLVECADKDTLLSGIKALKVRHNRDFPDDAFELDQ